ncbi:MAG: OmpA family protein [Sulfurimonas sp.]|nr:OmpA family protein [Sulfurimonas sp.]MDQ7060138.1 OmpA family protein [Sulfurimonas sp.]
MKKFTLFYLVLTSLTAIAAEFAYIQPISVETETVSAKTFVEDDDKDSIVNKLDKCLNTPLNTKVDMRGCKLYLDDDKDGVSNRDDKCPKTRSGVSVNTDGCEPDADADGVIDEKDECPNTSKEFIVDNTGCPQTAVLKIEFASGDYKILAKSNSKIEEFADFLQQNDGYQVIIYGYTDNLGQDTRNNQLSRDRARAVMNALIEHGVNLTRLTAIGLGSKNPVADNATSEGRMKNRRIEVELLQ